VSRTSSSAGEVAAAAVEPPAAIGSGKDSRSGQLPWQRRQTVEEQCLRLAWRQRAHAGCCILARGLQQPHASAQRAAAAAVGTVPPVRHSQQACSCSPALALGNGIPVCLLLALSSPAGSQRPCDTPCTAGGAGGGAGRAAWDLHPQPCCCCCCCRVRYREQRDISAPESLNLFLETRFEQLKTACELEMWAEAFRSVEDIQALIALGQAAAQAADDGHLLQVTWGGQGRGPRVTRARRLCLWACICCDRVLGACGSARVGVWHAAGPGAVLRGDVPNQHFCCRCTGGASGLLAAGEVLCC